MTRARFSELFEAEKPVIAMAHLPPLPGTPLYDEKAGVDGIVDAVRADLDALLDALAGALDGGLGPIQGLGPGRQLTLLRRARVGL